MVQSMPTRDTKPIKPRVNPKPCRAKIPGKKNAPTKAPTFAIAADIPWPLARMLLGYISEGIKKVVVFGPKLTKK